jgi:hypothetical protein
MTYSTNEIIEAVDYNAIVGANTTTNVNEFNTVWGIGSGNKGYGQTPIQLVNQYTEVNANSWSSLFSSVANSAIHQGTAYTTMSTPAVGGTITFQTGLVNNVTAVYDNRLNASAQGSTSANTVTRSGTWSDTVTFTQTVTFQSGDKARYFFNAGGQLAITLDTPSGSRADGVFYAMAQAAGTIVLSGHTSGVVSIAGTQYTGISKIGGSTSGVVTYNQNLGYFGLTTVDQEVYRQGGVTAYHGYVNSYISISMKTNGTQGSNGDNGNVITITTVWKEVPTGIPVASGTNVTVTLRPPSTARLTNSWGSVGAGTITLAGSVTGS